MNSFDLIDIADQAAKETNAAAHEVCVGVESCGPGEYNYLIWTAKRGRGLVSTRLAAEVTPLVRLVAHVEGFIENTL